MRLSPSGRQSVYIAGKGLNPPDPTVTLRLADGTERRIAPGHSARWLSESAIVWSPQADGPPLQIARAADGWQPHDAGIPAGNRVTAAAGRYATSRTRPNRTFTLWRGDLDGVTDPVLSDDGEWLATLEADRPSPGVSTLWIERAVDGTRRRVLSVGAISNPRFGIVRETATRPAAAVTRLPAWMPVSCGCQPSAARAIWSGGPSA